ncbi:hypothetical protein MTsDn1_26430 [Alteromonas sp. MTD1]
MESVVTIVVLLQCFVYVRQTIKKQDASIKLRRFF